MRVRARPFSQRRTRSEYEIELAMKLGGGDDGGKGGHEKEVGLRATFATPDNEVGFEERVHGPPGLTAPLLVSNSLDNHRLYAYKGPWRRGKMHGYGVYQFADKTTYKGWWKDGVRNNPDTAAHSVSVYPDGSSYVGSFAAGKFEG